MRISRLITCAAIAALVAGCAGFATRDEHDRLGKKVDELRQGLSDANGRVEELNNKFSLLQERLEEQSGRIDRLSSAPASAPEGLKVVTLGETGAKNPAEGAVARDQRPLQGPPPKTEARPQSAPEGRPEKAPQGVPDEARSAEKTETMAVKDAGALYSRGQDLFMAGRFGEAREVFSSLVALFPASRLADNALYWIGESYYSERDFEKALEKFRQTADLYPNENKAPDALFKAGLTLLEMNAPDRAKREFDALIKRYPDSEAAGKAQKMLKKDSGKVRKN